MDPMMISMVHCWLVELYFRLEFDPIQLTCNEMKIEIKLFVLIEIQLFNWWKIQKNILKIKRTKVNRSLTANVSRHVD